MTLTAKDVAEIMRLLEDSSFDTLSLEIDGMKLNLRRNSAGPFHHTQNTTVSSAASSSAPSWAASKPKPVSKPGLIDVTAPLLGIFYRAPKPGEPPFIEVGSKVEKDTVIGIIEVMKLMNSVHAGVKGEIVEIMTENGAAVEYGEILLRVRPEAAHG